MPPLAAIYWPVIHLAASETTSNTASATSSGSPATLPNLAPAESFVLTSSLSSPAGNQVAASVLVGPGATVLTVIPWRGPSYTPHTVSIIIPGFLDTGRLTSAASAAVRCSCAALLAPYTPRPGTLLIRETTLPMLTMRPPDGMYGAAA